MRLLLVGFGTVGQGLAELLLSKKESLIREHGFDWTVTGINDAVKGSCYDPSGIDLRKALTMAENGQSLSEYTPGGNDWDAPQAIASAEADAVVELTFTDIKTGEPATGHVRAALEQGRHVVTTNKGPIALYGSELLRLANDRGVQLLFEGTVMSGTPVMNTLRDALAGSDVSEIRGILNGTTNYILTRMEEGLDYESALKKAQELGYAEAVPDADVLGWDALAKVTILANMVFGANLRPDDLPCKGITEITAGDVARATNDGRRYKLIGRVWRDGEDVKASVAPELVEMGHPLASVMGATNAVTLTTDTVKEVTIVGPGAGKVETGFSVLTDLLHIGRTAR
jgi:homoserine dehydrogenase